MLTAFAEDLAPWLFSRSATPLCAEASALDAAVAHEFPAPAKTRPSVRPTIPPVRGMAHATRRDGVTRGRGVTPVGRARARGGRRAHAGDARVFQIVRGVARARVADDDVGSGAAVVDAAVDLAAGLFEMDSLVAAAVASARGVRDDVEWLRVRADARARIACRVASLGSLRHFLAIARARDARVAGVDGSNPTARITRDVFGAMVNATYPTESELGAAARDARAALSRAYAAADAADARGEGATTSAMLAASRAAPDLAAAMRIVELGGDTLEARVRILLSGDPDERHDAPDGTSRAASPSPARLAAGVRAARACAFGEADPARRRRSPRSNPPCSSAGAASDGWNACSVRQGRVRARGRDGGGVRVRARGDDVRRVAGGDEGRRAAHARALRVASQDAAHAVPSPRASAGGEPYVLVKRYSDFRALHMDVEEEGLTAAVGPALSLPDAANFAGAFAPSSDPNVVAARRVALQRYVDLLAGSGCSDAKRRLRVFLRLDDPPYRRVVEGRGVFGCGMLDCGVGEFFGARAASW